MWNNGCTKDNLTPFSPAETGHLGAHEADDVAEDRAADELHPERDVRWSL